MDVEFGLKEKILQYYFLNRTKVHQWFLGTTIVAVSLVAYLSFGPSDRDYAEAKRSFEKWKDSPSDDGLAKNMKKSLNRLPGLTKGLESEIAQTYLSCGESDKAAAFALSPLARLREISPFHAEFGEGALLIERGEFQKALELSVALKEKLEQSLGSDLWKGKRMGPSSAVYVSNLLRIACLQKQLKNAPGELAAWEELKGLLEAEGEVSTAAKILRANFDTKKFTLLDFISQRERSIVSAR